MTEKRFHVFVIERGEEWGEKQSRPSPSELLSQLRPAQSSDGRKARFDKDEEQRVRVFLE